MALLINAYAWAAFLLAGQVMSGVAQMFLPVLLFLAAEAVTRDKRDNFTEIICVLPYNEWVVVGGRALALLTLFMLLGVELLFTMLLAANTELQVYVSWSACWAFMVKYIVACINAVGITFLAASLVKKNLRLYILLFLWWLIGVFLASNTGTLFPLWTAIVDFAFIQGFAGNPSELAGLFPGGNLVATVVSFQVACSILLVIIAIMIEKTRRGPREAMLKAMVVKVLPCAAAVAVCFYLAGVYGIQGYNKVIPPHSVEDTVPAMAVSGSPSAVTLTGYDLYVKLDNKNNTMAVKAKVAMKNPKHTTPQAIEFTLRDYLRVHQVVAVETGELLSWQQQGNYLLVNPSLSFAGREALTIEISYSGRVWEWSEDFNGQPSGLVNFVASPFTCLRGGHAWYPVLGRHPLYTTTGYIMPWGKQSREQTRSLLVSHNPVPFTLTIDSNEVGTFISNLASIEGEQQAGIQRYKFSSPACRDVFLFAGPYEHTKLAVGKTGKSVDIYHFPTHTHNLKYLANKFYQINYYDSLVPREKTASVLGGAESGYIIFEVPRFFIYDSLMRTNNLGLIDAVPMPEAIFVTKALLSPWWSRPTGHVLSEARVLNLWWPNCFSEVDGDIADGFALYMYSLYKEEKHGKQFYENARAYWLAYNDNSPDNGEMLDRRGRVVREVFILMDTIRRSNLGDDGVREVLRSVHASYRDKRALHITDITAALERIGVFDNDDGQRKNGDSLGVKCCDSINTLNELLTNPPEKKLRGTLDFKMSWDFSAEVKVFKTK